MSCRSRANPCATNSPPPNACVPYSEIFSTPRLSGPDPAGGGDAGEAREGGAEGHHRRHCAVLHASRRPPSLSSGGRGAAGGAEAGSAAVARALAQADAEPEQGLQAGDRQGRDGPPVREHPDPLGSAPLAHLRKSCASCATVVGLGPPARPPTHHHRHHHHHTHTRVTAAAGWSAGERSSSARRRPCPSGLRTSLNLRAARLGGALLGWARTMARTIPRATGWTRSGGGGRRRIPRPGGEAGVCGR